jgi:HMG (high mobility group) box
MPTRLAGVCAAYAYVRYSQTRKAVEKTEKAPRGGARKKDPKAPKRALSAYMFFSQDWRERIRSENPDASFGLSSSLVLVVLTWAEGF